MPRQVRIEFPGATYHIMCRGDRREDIFCDDGDREMMLATLAETVEKTGWRVHAWGPYRARAQSGTDGARNRHRKAGRRSDSTNC